MIAYPYNESDNNRQLLLYENPICPAETTNFFLGYAIHNPTQTGQLFILTALCAYQMAKVITRKMLPQDNHSSSQNGNNLIFASITRKVPNLYTLFSGPFLSQNRTHKQRKVAGELENIQNEIDRKNRRYEELENIMHEIIDEAKFYYEKSLLVREELFVNGYKEDITCESQSSFVCENALIPPSETENTEMHLAWLESQIEILRMILEKHKKQHQALVEQYGLLKASKRY